MNLEAKKDLIMDAIDEYRKKESLVRKERIYHNTKLLMENYTKLKKYADNAVYQASQLFESIENVLLSDDSFIEGEYITLNDKDNIYVGSILKSKVRTGMMLQHIDIALEILKEITIQDKDKYNSFTDLYLGNMTYESLAEKYHCAERTIRRWKNEMLNELSVLLFGESALIL